MNTLHLNLWLRRARPNQKGEFPIILKITANSTVDNVSTGEFVHPDKWEYKVIKGGKEKLINEQKVLGKGEDARISNKRLENIKNKIKDIFNKLDEKEELISASLIKDIYRGKGGHKKQTLIKACEFAVLKMRELVSAEEREGSTVDRYEYTVNNLRSFIKYQYGKEDIFLQDMITDGRAEFSFADDYEHYGKTVTTKDKKTTWKHNYCKKELGRIHTMLLKAVKKGWISKSPIEGHSLTEKKGDPKYLTPEQVALIEETNFVSENLQTTKDIFLFCCYTGLSYAEIYKLSEDHFTYGIEGKDFIFVNRKKTKNSTGKICKIPLIFEKTKELKLKYKNHPACINRGKSFPVLSNKEYNKLLKIIQSTCNEAAALKNNPVRINEKLTTHVARHTCACMFLDRGYSKEFVAEMLGHKETDLVGVIYGEITAKRMSNEINFIEKRFEAKENNIKQS